MIQSTTIIPSMIDQNACLGLILLQLSSADVMIAAAAKCRAECCYQPAGVEPDDERPFEYRPFDCSCDIKAPESAGLLQ